MHILAPYSFFRHIYFSLFILLCTGAGVFAQNVNAPVLPSPNNTFLGAAGTAFSGASLGVDLYTGTAEINVPMCNLASKELNLPISLDYIGARGNRVQDYAGSVGLGWQLNAGGSVSRMVRGFPDEGSNGYLGTGQWGKVIANSAVNGVAWTQAQSQAITGINSSGSQGVPTADGEPDLYSVKTPYFAFQFTFDENGNAVVSNANGIKIIPPNYIVNFNASNTGFIVMDDAGNEFYFGSSYLSVENSTASIFGTNYNFPTTWYLDKIVSYNSKDIISLSYTSYFSSDVYKHYIYNTNTDITNRGSTNSTPVQTTINQPLVVTKITSSLGEADFLYDNHRLDDVNGVSLSQVALASYNPQAPAPGNIINLQTYNLKYSYFNGGSSDPNLLRLRLDSISVMGYTATTFTPITLKTFTYNALDLPSRQSLSQVDYWGYYTSSQTNPNNQALPPNQTYAMADVLIKISDLAGASYQLTYELNAYYNTSSSTNIQVGGLRVKQISKVLASTGETLTTQYSYVDASGNSTGQILSTAYAITSFPIPICSLWPGTETFSQSPADIYDLNGNFVGYSSVKTLPPTGGYSISTFSNFSSPGSADTYVYQFSPLAGSAFPDIAYAISMAYKRGLLLDNVVYNSSGNMISEDATPLTDYISLTSPVIKTGWAYHWANLSFSVSGGSGYLNSCNQDASSAYWTVVENFRPSVTIHTDYDQNNPASFVKVTTSYSYSADKRLVDTVSVSSDSKGQTYTKTTYHPDDTGIPLVTTGEQTALTAMVNANRINVPVHEKSSRNGSIRETHYSYGAGMLSSNNLFSNTYLTSVTDFKTVGTTRTQIRQKNYSYDVNTSNLISSNEYTGPANTNLVGKLTSYAYGYNNCYPIASIENANASSSFYQGNGSLNGYFSQTASIPISVWSPGTTTFSVYASGSFSGATITVSYSITGPSVQNGSGTVSVDGAVLSASFSNLPSGNYTINFSASSSNGIYSPTFYYMGSYPQLLTTTTNQFFYEGFENYPLTSNIIVSGAHSGNVYYSGSAGAYTIPFVIPDSRSYILQYFSLVSGNWVFHEQPYTGSIPLTGPIDDIRIFPTDALMTSYTYNPLVGLTSQTDPSGKTQISQYDGLNRLVTVRDQDNNILKQYDYEYQLLTAPVYNTPQSGTFTRTTCPTGYTGLPVTYTVAAHMYSSYIGQGDANAKAMADVNANGQANANGQSTACAAPSIIVNGPSSALAGSPTGSGTITGTAGRTVIVSMGAGGMPGYSLTMTVKNGSTVIGSGVCTTPTSSFTFVMPSSGVASYTLSFSGTQGGGSFTLSLQ